MNRVIGQTIKILLSSFTGDKEPEPVRRDRRSISMVAQSAGHIQLPQYMHRRLIGGYAIGCVIYQHAIVPRILDKHTIMNRIANHRRWQSHLVTDIRNKVRLTDYKLRIVIESLRCRCRRRSRCRSGAEYHHAVVAVIRSVEK